MLQTPGEKQLIPRIMLHGAVFMDLSKAFDCIDHEIILAKLPFYGFDKGIQLWLRSYLTHRTQRVCSQNDYSDWGYITMREYCKVQFWGLYCLLFISMTYQMQLNIVISTYTLMTQSYITVVLLLLI